MGANKADIYNPVGVIDPHDKSILVPRNIEHRSAVFKDAGIPEGLLSVSYTHLRAHETVLDLVCRLLLEKKND